MENDDSFPDVTFPTMVLNSQVEKELNDIVTSLPYSMPENQPVTLTGNVPNFNGPEKQQLENFKKDNNRIQPSESPAVNQNVKVPITGTSESENATTQSERNKENVPIYSQPKSKSPITLSMEQNEENSAFHAWKEVKWTEQIISLNVSSCECNTVKFKYLIRCPDSQCGIKMACQTCWKNYFVRKEGKSICYKCILCNRRLSGRIKWPFKI